MTKRIITISRQYGSGGREVGEYAAKLLGYAYYDKELVNRAAKLGDIDPDMLRTSSEGIKGMLSNLLSYADIATGKDEDSLPLVDRIFLIQSRTIRQIADEGPCVIIGHCADYVLAEYQDVLNVFIHSDYQSRVARVMKRNDLSENEAIARIRKTDKNRAHYYEQYTDKPWGNAANYDISLSSSYFGIEGTAKLIAEIAENY